MSVRCTPRGSHRAFGNSECGLSLVELMLAMVIGLFLIAGVVGVLISTRQSTDIKRELDRTQESLRFGATAITRVVRLATAIDAASTEDRLIVQLPGGAGRPDCAGLTGAGTNTFRVEANRLVCTDVDGNPGNVLLRGVESLSLAYGIDADSDGVLRNSEYRETDNVEAAGGWPEVISTRVTLTLTPLEGQDGAAEVSFVATMRARTLQASGGPGVRRRRPNRPFATGRRYRP